MYVHAWQAGANRMEALQDPFTSVPLGTIGAVVISLVLYVLLLWLWATVAEREYLTGEACGEHYGDSDSSVGPSLLYAPGAPLSYTSFPII